MCSATCTAHHARYPRPAWWSSCQRSPRTSADETLAATEFSGSVRLLAQHCGRRCVHGRGRPAAGQSLSRCSAWVAHSHAVEMPMDFSVASPASPRGQRADVYSAYSTLQCPTCCYLAERRAAVSPVCGRSGGLDAFCILILRRLALAAPRPHRNIAPRARLSRCHADAVVHIM
jgi:hypothetical protein